MNKLSTGHYAIGDPTSEARTKQWDEIAQNEAEARLELPEGHSYGKDSIAAKYVAAFLEGAAWQRNNPI